ncbi:MAG: phage tail terminator-like protein, partial [Pontimonas sp.]
MNYQAIRASMENPLLTAFNNLSPAVPVYFDNITAVPPNTTTEYVRVNITFGLTNEPTLTSSVDNARGALVIRVFTEKGRGPARNQELVTTAVNVLETINNTSKTTTGVFVKVGEINGPSFSATEESPHFMGRIDTGYVATVLT